jgi:hypothetical protein
MPAEQVRPRQGAVLFQRDAGRAGPQQKRDPNTGPRSATYTHVPTPCKVAQPMDRAQHCHCLRSCRSDPSIIGGPGRDCIRVPPPAPRAHETPLHSGRNRSIRPTTGSPAYPAVGSTGHMHAQAAAAATVGSSAAGLYGLCLPRSAGARLCAAACGHARPPPGGYATCKRAPGAGREGAGLPEPEPACARARPYAMCQGRWIDAPGPPPYPITQ